MARKHKRTKARAAARKAQAVQVAQGVPAQAKPKVGLLVTDELEKAISKCREDVHRIVKDCRAKNRKFRDIEFDLDNDKSACLSGLVPDESLVPTGVSRVTDIYTKPQFFIDGASSNDIVQGQLGNCWFLSSLSTASLSNGLIEKFCVARDGMVGVYGFVFFKNGSWVSVIIDDLLFVNVPKFEELNWAEQQLFHMDKKRYNKMARKGGKNLYFARSGTENETWVPLVEKAYAKLHGDYASLNGGRAAEALEDLTGGVSSMILTKDILDVDRFWTEELLRANVDRLFSAAYGELDTARSGKASIQVEGLWGAHAYSILKAVEVHGKRFLIIRNPWGDTEWKGPWSDGSKEWTPEWLARLPEIGHVFGEDGQFIMEYSDFLQQFEDIDKTILFDSTWKMSMEWLRVPVKPPPCAWSFGAVSFNFTIAEATKAIIVLSKLDERYFRGIDGCYYWSLQFEVYKIGEDDTELVAESEQPVWGSRSVNTEASLEPGNYSVQVRIDGLFRGDPPNWEDFNKRKLARTLSQRSQGRLNASNYDPLIERDNFPIPKHVLLDREKAIAGLRARRAAVAEAETASSTPVVGDLPEDMAGEEKKVTGSPVDDENKVGIYKARAVAEGSTSREKKKDKKKTKKEGDKQGDEKGKEEGRAKKKHMIKKESSGLKKPVKPGPENSSYSGSNSESERSDSDSGSSSSSGSSSDTNSEGSRAEDGNDSDYVPSMGGTGSDIGPGGGGHDSSPDEVEPIDVYVGLRLYTQGREQVTITGMLKEESVLLYATAVYDQVSGTRP